MKKTLPGSFYHLCRAGERREEREGERNAGREKRETDRENKIVTPWFQLL